MRIVKFNESVNSKFYVDDVKDYFLDLIESDKIEHFGMSTPRDILNTPIDQIEKFNIQYQVSIKNDKYLEATEYNNTNVYKLIKKMDGLRNIVPDLKIYDNGNFRSFTIIREMSILKYISYLKDIISKLKSCRVQNVFLDRINIQVTEDQWEDFQKEIESTNIIDNFEVTKHSPFFDSRKSTQNYSIDGVPIKLTDTTPRIKNIRYSIDSSLYEDPLEFILSMD
jgi:hypothetical protein